MSLFTVSALINRSILALGVSVSLPAVAQAPAAEPVPPAQPGGETPPPPAESSPPTTPPPTATTPPADAAASAESATPSPAPAAPAPAPVAEPAQPVSPPPPAPLDTTAAVSPLSFVDSWKLSLYGRVRASYDWVADDPDVDFVGDNSGFNLRSARLGLKGTHGDIGFKVSLEAASELRERINTPEGTLDVRARDAFLMWNPSEYFGIAVGQLKVGFDYENWRGTETMPFASRAVGQEGVPAGFGFQEPPLVADREIGVRLMPSEPIEAGKLRFNYVLSAVNGNGQNEVLDDNGRLAFFGRIEVGWEELVTLGGGVLQNKRRVGELPNLFDEKDFGFAADLRVTWEGLEVMGQFVQVTTEFETTGSEDRKRIAYHAQASYKIDQLPIPIAPGYRFAVYEPWADASSSDGGIDLEAFTLTYHTIGVGVFHPDAPLSAHINYTITQEDDARELDNDRLEVLTQVVF